MENIATHENLNIVANTVSNNGINNTIIATFIIVVIIIISAIVGLLFAIIRSNQVSKLYSIIIYGAEICPSLQE